MKGVIFRVLSLLAVVSLVLTLAIPCVTFRTSAAETPVSYTIEQGYYFFDIQDDVPSMGTFDFPVRVVLREPVTEFNLGRIVSITLQNDLAFEYYKKSDPETVLNGYWFDSFLEFFAVTEPFTVPSAFYEWFLSNVKPVTGNVDAGEIRNATDPVFIERLYFEVPFSDYICGLGEISDGVSTDYGGYWFYPVDDLAEYSPGLVEMYEAFTNGYYLGLYEDVLVPFLNVVSGNGKGTAWILYPDVNALFPILYFGEAGYFYGSGSYQDMRGMYWFSAPSKGFVIPWYWLGWEGHVDIYGNRNHLNLYDHTGSIEIGELNDIIYPCTVAVTDNGFQITNAGSDEVSQVYEFGGTAEFKGINFTPGIYGQSGYIERKPGDVFTLSDHAGAPTFYICADEVEEPPVYPTGYVTIYDYSGSTEIFEIDNISMPSTVKVTSDGLEFYAPDSTAPEYTYTFSGTGEFVGVNAWANATALHYPIGSTFEISGNISIYLVIEGNISDGGGLNTDDIWNGPPGSGDIADNVGDGMNNAIDGVHGGSDDLKDLTPDKPTLDTDLVLDPDAVLLVNGLMNTWWTTSGVVGNLGIVCVVGAVAYVFFGKKDG